MPAPRLRHDWEAFLRLAERHKVVPWLRSTLDLEALPESVRIELCRRFKAVQFRNLGMAGELLEILGLFEQQGVAAVPIKGPALAETLYGGLGGRQFEDLDILLARRDLPLASALLEKRGYRAGHAGDTRWPAHAIHLRTEFHFPFVHVTRGISVELHGEIAPYYFSLDLDTAGLLERAVPTRLAGRMVRALSMEDTVLLLCAHGGKHAWNSLELVAGLALAAKRPEVDWDVVLARAAEVGGRRLVLTGLALADHLAGSGLAGPVREAAAADSSAIRRLVGDAVAGLFQGADSPVFVRLPLFHLRSRERVRDRLRYCLRMMAPNGEDVHWLPLPLGLFWLYWVVRPVRVVWVLRRALSQFVWRDFCARRLHLARDRWR